MNQKNFNGKPIAYRFSQADFSYNQTAPCAFIGRYICCLSQTEKKSPLIAKLLERIRRPSTKELNELNAKFEVRVIDGVCHMFAQTGARSEEKIFNLGTKALPAFFYDKFIFILDKKQRVFKSVELKIVFFNENYVLIWLGNDLLVKFDVKGLGLMGRIKDLHVLKTTFSTAYVVEVVNAKKTRVVYGLTGELQKLFELDENASFEVSDGRVFLKAEDGCIEYIFAVQQNKFMSF